MEGARYHQFAGEPPAKIVFDLLLNYKDIPPAILAAYIVESVKVLLKWRKKKTAQHTGTEVIEPVSGELTDNGPIQPVNLTAEPTAPFAKQPDSPTQIGGGTEDNIPARITLEFRADARHASIECDGSEPSERLLETVIRTLAEVTPIDGESLESTPPE